VEDKQSIAQLKKSDRLEIQKLSVQSGSIKIYSHGHRQALPECRVENVCPPLGGQEMKGQRHQWFLSVPKATGNDPKYCPIFNR
jgi:hypothetical protein